MKNKKRMLMIVGTVMVLIVAASVTAYAATASTPAEILADLTGQSVDEVVAERIETGSTYGAMADEEGVLDEFKSLLLEQRKTALEKRVNEGTMTQERAEAIIERMETNQATCDGNCEDCIGQGLGYGASGEGQGLGLGQGNGTSGDLGQGYGAQNKGMEQYGQGKNQNGAANRDGSCLAE